MALTAAELTAEPRAFSIGPWKVKFYTYEFLDNDTSGTLTVSDLSEVIMCLVDETVTGLTMSYSGNVVTLGITDPGATIAGRIMVIGR